MILRRPDAFIIKHIKLIHAIILLGIGYLLFKTNEINTIYERLAADKSKTIKGSTYSSQTYNFYMYIILIFCLIAVVTIMLLLIKRKKRFIFYVATTLLLIFVFAFYLISYSNISTMESRNVNSTLFWACYDISRMAFYIQSVFTFAWLFKTTGFDIKTFSFGQISYDLDLTDGDDEEIEFSLEIDGNDLKTKRRRKLRNLKYIYLEKRWKFNAIGILTIAILIVVTLMAIEASKPVYYELGNELKSRYYDVVVNNVYLATSGYDGKKIGTNDTFIVLMFKLKKNIEQEYTFDDFKISVTINDKVYYADSQYFEYFSDLGEAYKEQNLTQEYNDYYLVYHIPYDFSTKDIYVKVASNFDNVTNRYSYYEIKTTYERLGKSEDTKEYELSKEMNIEAYGIKNKVVINDFLVQETFKLTSSAQVGDKTYNLTEYITPLADDNEEKIIMRLNYNETYDDNNKNSFASILAKYAIIEYEINNTKKEGKIYSFVSPKLSKEPNVKYIQVSSEVLKGKNRVIKIRIRDKIFEYKLD